MAEEFFSQPHDFAKATMLLHLYACRAVAQRVSPARRVHMHDTGCGWMIFVSLIKHRRRSGASPYQYHGVS
jgi:hypothetical protein